MSKPAWKPSDRSDVPLVEAMYTDCCGYNGLILDMCMAHIEMSRVRANGTMRVLLVTYAHCPKCEKQYMVKIMSMALVTHNNTGAKAFAVYDAEEIIGGCS